MLLVKTELPIDPDKREQAMDLFSEVAEKSREESGIVGYQVTVDKDDPNHLTLIEQFEDEEGFNSHMQAEHTQQLVEELPEIAGGELEAKQFEVESVSELDM
ncbi:MAG: putative quinol monooxygenase [Halovenus sp.]